MNSDLLDEAPTPIKTWNAYPQLIHDAWEFMLALVALGFTWGQLRVVQQKNGDVTLQVMHPGGKVVTLLLGKFPLGITAGNFELMVERALGTWNTLTQEERGAFWSTCGMAQQEQALRLMEKLVGLGCIPPMLMGSVAQGLRELEQAATAPVSPAAPEEET